MTGRTHDLMAFTTLSFILATQTMPKMTLATALIALSANFIGALAPDIDQPTADLWRRIPAGSVVGRIITPILGGHRYISHSLLGIFLFGFVLNYLLTLAKAVVLVDMNIVWWSFMIGYVSHLLIDSITHEGVPWLFPIPYKFGFPPWSFLRVKTGGFVEQAIIFPLLMVICGYIYYSHYTVFKVLLLGLAKH